MDGPGPGRGVKDREVDAGPDTRTRLPDGSGHAAGNGASAKNRDGEEFGTARLHELIADNGQAGAEELVQTILRQLRQFNGGNPLEDDLTILALRYG